MKSIFVAIALSALFAQQARADANTQRQATPINDDGGNAPILFDIACSTTAWTVVTSSDSISRFAFYFAPSANAVSVCLSSTTKAGDACNDSTPGLELPASAFWVDTTKAGWNCRGRTGTGSTITVYVKGYRGRDSGDYGWIKELDH